MDAGKEVEVSEFERDLEDKLRKDMEEIAKIDSHLGILIARKAELELTLSANNAALTTYRRNSKPPLSPDEQKAIVLKVVNGADPAEGIDCATIAEVTGLSSAQVSNVARVLVESGSIEKIKRGTYRAKIKVAKAVGE